MASCSIIRNPINKQIEQVLAPNGQKSYLFDSAVEYLRTTKDDVIQSKTKGNQNYVFQEDGVTITLNRRNGDLYLESVQNEKGYPVENVFSRVMDKFDKDGDVLYVDKTNPFSEKLIANAGFVESSDNPFTLVRENEEFKNIPSQKLLEEALTLQSIPYTEEFEVSFGKWNYTKEERAAVLERLAYQKKLRRQAQLRNLEKSRRMLKRAENLRNKRAKFQIVGEVGVSNLANSTKQETLDYAKFLESLGRSKQQIWRDTGWYNDVDGWKSEIPDGVVEEPSSLVFDKTDEEFKNNVAKTTLGEIYDNPLLYEMYPELKNQEVIVFQDDKSGDNGYVSKNKLYLNNRIYGFNGRESEASERETSKRDRKITHEIQHLVQQIEKFERGSDSGMFEPQVFAKIRRARELYNNGNDIDRARAEHLLREAGVAWVLSEVYSRNDSESYGDIIRDSEKFGIKIEELIEEAAEFNYLRSAGEVEARNVEGRFNMSEKERSEKAPFETEDYFSKHKIFIDTDISKRVKDAFVKNYKSYLEENKNNNLQNELKLKIERVFSEKFHNFRFVDNWSEFAKNLEQDELLKGVNGEVMGAVLGDGSIYINPDNFSEETLIHEASHLWEKLNPELWSEGVRVLKQAAVKNKELQKIVDDVRNTQKQLSEEEVYSEALNDFIGKWGQKKINTKDKDLGGLLKWLKDFFNNIFSIFNPNSEVQKSLEDFSSMVVAEIVGEKDLSVDNKNLIPERFKLSNEEIFGVYNEILEPLPTVGESRYLTDKDATDRNGEPYLKDVLVFDNLIRNWNATITPSQIYKLSNNFGHSFEGMEELYAEINKTFFPNGYFEIRTDLLFNSKLYSKGEAMYVLEHPGVQSNLQSFFEKIRKEYLSNNTYLENTINNNYFDEELIQYGDKIDDLGKVQIEDPIEVENYFKENLAGISDREVFDGIVKRLDKYPSFKQRYSYDKDFANQIFRKYSLMSKIFRAQIIKDEFSPRVKGSRFATMYETLQFSNKGMEVTQDTAFLSKLDDYVWSSEQKDVKAILKEIETKLVDYNIDVIGLSDLYDRKNKSEFIDFLNKINTFTEKVSNNTHSIKDISQLSQDIDNFFGRSASYEKMFKKVSDTNKGKTLVELTSEKDDLSLFEQHGLVKTSEGYYQKVSVENTLEEAYDRATDVIIQNPSLINGSNFKHLSFYKDGKFDKVAILDEVNRSAVKDALKTYFKKRANELNDPNLKNRTETAQKWTIYKLMNKNPMNTEKMPNFVQEEVKFQNYNGNYHYLTNNFHSDFQNYILKNKLDNTELYKNVLKYFEVNENGISLNTENNTIKQRIRNSYITDQTFENLKQYSIISKNKTMQDLFEFENDGVRRHNAAENQRYYYSNNFSQMESFKGDYEVSGNTLVANNSSDNFIRVKEGLFERVGQTNGVYVYGKQQIIENPNFNNYEYKLESPNVDIEVAREMVKPSVFSGSKSVKSYSKQEEDSLNQQHNECK